MVCLFFMRYHGYITEDWLEFSAFMAIKFPNILESSFFFLVYLLTLLGNLTVYKFQTLRKGSHDSECIMLRKKLGNPVNISLSCVFIT